MVFCLSWKFFIMICGKVFKWFLNKKGSVHVPPNRLLTLLRQAVAYQIEFSRYHPRVAPCVNMYVIFIKNIIKINLWSFVLKNYSFDSLLQDYTSFIIPNAICATLSGHLGNVKCVEFIGEEGWEIVSGSRWFWFI